MFDESVYKIQCTWRKHWNFVVFLMIPGVCQFYDESKMEQQECIKFCTNFWKAYWDSGRDLTDVWGTKHGLYTCVWVACSLQSQPLEMVTSPEGPSASQYPTLLPMLSMDWHQTIEDIVAEVGIGYGTSQPILIHALGKYHVAAKFVPRILSGHNQQHVAACRELHQVLSNDPAFLFRVITAGFTVMILRQSKNPRSGKSQAHQDWKMHSKWTGKSKACFSFSLMPRRLCTKN